MRDGKLDYLCFKEKNHLVIFDMTVRTSTLETRWFDIMKNAENAYLNKTRIALVGTRDGTRVRMPRQPSGCKANWPLSLGRGGEPRQAIGAAEGERASKKQRPWINLFQADLKPSEVTWAERI